MPSRSDGLHGAARMRCEWMLLAEGASKTEDGKLSIYGIFNRLNTGGFPAKFDRAYVVARLYFDPDETGKTYTVEVKHLDSDGVWVSTYGIHVMIPALETTFKGDLIVYLESLHFVASGIQTLTLEVNGTEVKRIEFEAQAMSAGGG